MKVKVYNLMSLLNTALNLNSKAFHCHTVTPVSKVIL